MKTRIANSNMERFQLFALFIFLFLLASPQFDQDTTSLINISNEVEYYGKLESELVPDPKEPYGVVFNQTDNLSKYKFARPLEKDARVLVGNPLNYPTQAGGKFEILLVEPKAENPYFYADLNANDAFEENERLLFTTSKETIDYDEQILKLPLKNEFYKTFPIALRFKRGFKHPNLKADERLVVQS